MDDGSVLQEFNLRPFRVQLYVSPEECFLPNTVTRQFCKYVEINEGDVVFDIGTGVGPLAVWSALMPSREVHAVDIVQEHCDITLKNAELNGVGGKVQVYAGDLCDALPDGLKADVIIGDVSGLADVPARQLGWYPAGVPTGGDDGTEVITRLLRQVRSRLTDNGRFYFPVGVGLADDEKTLSVASECFRSLECKLEVTFPLSRDEYDRIKSALPEAFLRKIVTKGSRMVWKGLFYVASQPSL
jgi:hypothetical protein